MLFNPCNTHHRCWTPTHRGPKKQGGGEWDIDEDIIELGSSVGTLTPCDLYEFLSCGFIYLWVQKAAHRSQSFLTFALLHF